MERTKIAGIVLVRNEDLFVRQAVENIAAFCDTLILCDHASTDGTRGILADLAATLPNATLHAIRDPADSHGLVKEYAGSATWVFGADGDEIYDPAGLMRMRERLLRGEFSDAWAVFGNVLNVTELDLASREAAGHLSPPCRSMTKLYNFAAIDAWDGFCPERLHGGTPRFREGYSALSRCALNETTPWEAADFRCLHVCFLRRSSLDSEESVRANLMEIQGGSRLSRVAQWLRGLLGVRPRVRWKNERYRRGPLTRVPTDGFFREHAGARKDLTAP